jgi:DNA topoisomerase-1
VERLSKSGNKKLVIVESPTKARTIRRFLSSDYEVEASMGHVRDLPASAAEIPASYKDQPWARLGVRVDNGFEPLYVIAPKKRQIVTKLRGMLKNASELYIATDEDREGESIGWHLLELLEPKVPVHRMVFNEITESAIQRALQETRQIDQNLVDAQETRRILDRLVGYTISPLLWRKIAPKLSAGRVQSVAVRLMVMREQERLAFVPAEYWDLKAQLRKQQGQAGFDGTLTHVGDLRVAGGRDFDPDTGRLRENLQSGRDLLLLNGQEAQKLVQDAREGPWRVTSVEERRATRTPSPPFTTSTLQQEASRKLGMTARDTMRVAQGLYENGLITYMRTDSTNLAQEAVDGSRQAILTRYGKEFLSPAPRQFRTKSRSAQEAHEAIRPAGSEMRTRDELKLEGREGQLYDLIWKRTVATQMADAQLKFVTARIEARLAETFTSGSVTADALTFRASGRTTIFPGFFRAYVEGSDDPDAVLDDREQPLPALARGDALDCTQLEALGHETRPPARFTEASLVKILESEGIGRPSTYASIIDTVIRRGYVRKNGSQLVPTFVAFATNNLLEHQFRQLVDTEFTAHMEQSLDDIAAGKLDHVPYLRSFYAGEEGIEARVQEGLAEIDAREISTISSGKWGEYQVRVGRYGPYVTGEVEGAEASANIPEDIAPADLTLEKIEELLREGRKGAETLGMHPELGMEMLLKRGPYGPYLQLGDDEQEGRPRRMSLPKELNAADVTFETAASLLSLPRKLGEHPDSGKQIEASIGRFGPYVKHDRLFASLPKDEDVLTVGFERALELIRRKEDRNRPLRTLGADPVSGDPVEVREGRYGPYVTDGSINASLKKDQDPEQITLEQALELIKERAADPNVKKRKPRKAAAKKTAGKAAKGRAKARKKPAGPKRPKATTADLEPFVAGLPADVASVVTRVEGIGVAASPVSAVAAELGIPEDEVKKLHKSGMFRLRMAFGKARSEAEAAG